LYSSGSSGAGFGLRGMRQQYHASRGFSSLAI
jgi:hypothetical protein